MDRTELMEICRRWALRTKGASVAAAMKFARYYADHYPNGDREMPRVWEREQWAGDPIYASPAYRHCNVVTLRNEGERNA